MLKKKKRKKIKKKKSSRKNIKRNRTLFKVGHGVSLPTEF